MLDKTHMKLYLQKVEKQDAVEVISILRKSAEWMLSKGIVQRPLDWLDSIESELILSVKSGNFYFPIYHGEPVGVVEVLTAPEKIWKYDSSPSIYLHKLAIKRENAGSGVGVSVIKLLTSWASKNKKRYVRLDCVASNIKLRNYYESNDFKLKGIESNELVELALYEKQTKI